MEFIRRLKKNRAIQSYVKKLPGLLAKDYGRSAHYRPLQIKRTIERAGLDPIYSCYAIARSAAIASHHFCLRARSLSFTAVILALDPFRCPLVRAG